MSGGRAFLRRFATGELIGKNDLRLYTDAVERTDHDKVSPWCKKPEGSHQAEHTPIDKTHGTATAQGSDPVRLVNTVHDHGANDLATGAALDLNPIGLTIVARNNGSDTSGYARALKQVAAMKEPPRGLDERLPSLFCWGPLAGVPSGVVDVLASPVFYYSVRLDNPSISAVKG